MGKYYALNDSTEKAIACFENAQENSSENKDTTYQCLSLLQSSYLHAVFDQKKALKYSRIADNMYSKFSNAKTLNSVLYKLNTCYCLTLVDSLNEALKENLTAVEVALINNDSIALSNAYQNQSLVYRKMGNANASLSAAKKAMSYWDEGGISCEIQLANSFLKADSLSQAERVYRNALNGADRLQSYTIYTRLHEIAILQNDKENAVIYADSAYQSLGIMYSTSLEQRNAHYEKLMSEEKKKNEAERIANRSKWIIGIALFVMCCIMYNYIMYRRRAQERVKEERQRAELRLQHEKELHEQESSFRKEQYEKDLKSRDLQIEIMRKYLMEKIKIAQKIKDVKEGKSKPIFTEDDWKDIEIFLENSECGFVSRLRAEFPELREKDVRLMMLLRVKMPQKSIAEYYGISEKAVKQKLFLYKEKVGIKDENVSLREFIETY